MLTLTDNVPIKIINLWPNIIIYHVTIIEWYIHSQDVHSIVGLAFITCYDLLPISIHSIYKSKCFMFAINKLNTYLKNKWLNLFSTIAKFIINQKTKLNFYTSKNIERKPISISWIECSDCLIGCNATQGNWWPLQIQQSTMRNAFVRSIMDWRISSLQIKPFIICIRFHGEGESNKCIDEQIDR